MIGGVETIYIWLVCKIVHHLVVILLILVIGLMVSIIVVVLIETIILRLVQLPLVIENWVSRIICTIKRIVHVVILKLVVPILLSIILNRVRFALILLTCISSTLEVYRCVRLRVCLQIV